MTRLGFSLERAVVIRASRETVFRFFTDSERFARWWGAGSTIEGRVGGAVRVCHPGGTTASGEVLELLPGSRIVFSYGYDAPGHAVGPGASRVTIELDAHAEGTRLRLLHELPDAAVRDEHVQGWRFQLALFAVTAAADAHAGVAARIDSLLRAWGEPDPATRRRLLEESVSEDVEFRDAFSCTRGRDDLEAHMAAAAVHMPGVRLEREGDPQQCQGVVLTAWAASAGGQPRGRGHNVCLLAPDGRLKSLVGFWAR